MKSTFRILFYINRNKKKNGLVPIFGRITINGTMAQFSCKCSIPEELWSIPFNCAKGKSGTAYKVNLILDGFRSQIYRSYQKFILTEPFITARMIKEDFLHTGNEYKTLLNTMDKEMKSFRERVGKDRALKTYQKMEAVRSHLKEFIRIKYNAPDIYLHEADQKFIISFSRYVQFEKGLQQSTVWVYCTFLKKIFIMEYNNGTIRRNPFYGVELGRDIKEKQFLTEDEIKRMIECNMPTEKLQKVKELFLFCCFTGISYIDLKHLVHRDIKIINGEPWIIATRHKNRMPYQIKILEYPLRILHKYAEPQPHNSRIFSLESYTHLNRLIKHVGKLCGLEKKITFHVARHSFATLAISRGMPIESISKILGHSNIVTTQIYARIINKKLDNDLSELGKNLQGLWETSLFKKREEQIN